jgi:hypothetical protein
MMRWEHIWAAEVLAAFAPSCTETPGSHDPQLAPCEGEVDYLRTYRRMVTGSTPLAGLGLRFALIMVALAPVWLLGRFATISKLARSERTELLSKLLRHGSLIVRELSLLLKFTAAVALLGTPSVRARSGYDNVPPVANVQREAARRILPVFEPVHPVHVEHPIATAPVELRVLAESVRPSDQVAS